MSKLWTDSELLTLDGVLSHEDHVTAHAEALEDTPEWVCLKGFQEVMNGLYATEVRYVQAMAKAQSIRLPEGYTFDVSPPASSTSGAAIAYMQDTKESRIHYVNELINSGFIRGDRVMEALREDNDVELFSRWVSHTGPAPGVLSPLLLHTPIFSIDEPVELSSKCRHPNKRASYVMKVGRKEEFFVCTSCGEEVL